MSEILSRPLVSFEFWPNGSKVTTCRAWLHADEREILELDERRLANKEERQQILAGLTDTPAETTAELAGLLTEAAIVVLEAQDRARHPRQAKDDKNPAKAELEPHWEEPVDGSGMMAELVAYLTRYIVFPSTWATRAVVLWIVMTHIHDASEFSPLLIITSATRGSGKSRVLEVLELLVLRPWMNISPSDAVLYRKVDIDHPTLLVDEADNTNWRERPDLVAILNGGYHRGGAVVPRCVGEGFEPKDFSVWAPKALAMKGLKGMPDTTLSRAVVIHMQRRKKDSEPVTRFRACVARKEAAPLRAKLRRWAADHFHDLANAQPTMPNTISDRAGDAWSPLAAIADAVGPDWGRWARKAAENLSGSELEAKDVSEQLLGDLRDILLQPRDEDGKPLPRIERITSADLVAKLKALDGAPWADWGRAGLTAHHLASLLRPFGIGPKQVWFPIEKNKQGYELAQFIDAFARNLAPSPRTLDSENNQHLRPRSETLDPEPSRDSESGFKSFSPITSRVLGSESPDPDDLARSAMAEGA